MSAHTPHYLAATNVLLVRNKKILLSRRQNKGWGDGLLCIPGGHIEAGETPAEAAVRELREELGITVETQELTFLCLEARRSGDRNYLSTIFTLKTDQEPINNEPHECSELVWVDPEHLGDDIIENFKHVIQRSYVDSEKYIEFQQL